MQKFIVTPNEAGQRVDKLLFKYLNTAPKSFIYKMFRKKNITLNHKKCDGSEKTAVGDEITLWLSEETIEKFRETKKVEINWKWQYEKNIESDNQDTKDGENLEKYEFEICTIGK